MLGIKDLDLLCARLHGRRALLPDAARLRALCGLGSPAALASALYPGEGITTAAALQARLVKDYAFEMAELSSALGGARARLLAWLPVCFQAENIKVRARALLSGSDKAAAAQLLLDLPPGMAAYGPALAAVNDLPGLASALPEGPLRRALERVLAAKPGGEPFFYEAELDRAYYMELAALAGALGAVDGPYAAGLARQEVAAYNLALAARGRFLYRIDENELLLYFAPGSAITRLRFKAMLAAPGIGALRAMAAGLALAAGPEEKDPAALEALARDRYRTMARRAWRGSHIGFGAVMGYAALRRLYTEDLIRLSEGLRLGLGPEAIYKRLAGGGTGEEHVQSR